MQVNMTEQSDDTPILPLAPGVIDDAIRALAARVTELREQANLTQEDLAERAGWSQSNISKLERGKHRPRLDKVLGLQHALELRSIEELFGAPPIPPTGRLMGTNG
jgi:DNA-binding XRE family transcriptional regulator